jgi:hypothetical protein
MSRYFSRLAQRTGLAVAPRATPAARAATPDIVEQDVHVDAAPAATATRIGAPALRETAAASVEESVHAHARPTTLVTPVKSPMSNSHAGNTTVGTSSLSRHSERSTDRAITATSRTKIPEQHEPSADSAEANVSGPLSDATSPAPRDVIDSSSRSPTVSSADAPKEARASFGRIDSAGTSPRAVRNSVKSSASDGGVDARKIDAPHVPDPIFVPASMGIRAPSLFERSIAADESVPSPDPRNAKGSVQTATKISAFAPAANNVEVRIGAVRLEIHPPPPAATADTSPSMPGPEPRRFAPRRYYLRG